MSRVAPYRTAVAKGANLCYVALSLNSRHACPGALRFPFGGPIHVD